MSIDSPFENPYIAVALAFRSEHLPPGHVVPVSDLERADYASGKLDARSAKDLRDRMLGAEQAGRLAQLNRAKFGAVLWAAVYAPAEAAATVREALASWGWPPDLDVPESAVERRRFAESWGGDGFRYLIQAYRADGVIK